MAIFNSYVSLPEGIAEFVVQFRFWGTPLIERQSSHFCQGYECLERDLPCNKISRSNLAPFELKWLLEIANFEIYLITIYCIRHFDT